MNGFGGMVVSDPMGNWLKCFASIALMVTLIYGRPYAQQRDMLRGGELFTLSMFALLGMFVMISGHNFLVLYMGLELLTLSSYALVALRRDDLKGHRSGHEVFCAGRIGQWFLAVWLVDWCTAQPARWTLHAWSSCRSLRQGVDQPQVLTIGLGVCGGGLGV
jgi:NADH-quinone oxidoreductase subunit N